MAETYAAEPASPTAGGSSSRGHRLAKVAAWLAGIALLLLFLHVARVDVGGWLRDLWDSIREISIWYILAAVVFQTAQTVLAGASYYGILRAAYPAAARFWPIVTAYAVGVALNGFLPANIGTFVTLFMFVLIIPGATFAGSFAAYLVQKIFFTLAGAFTYLYLFLSVPGSFDREFGGLTEHPVASIILVTGGAFLIVFVARLFWAQMKKLWAHARQGGIILSQPRRYLVDAFLPSLGSWAAKLVVTGIFLAAYSIPVTFNSIMHVAGSNSLANTVSVTPGGVGVTQAANVAALSDYTDAQTATAYSVAQQLVVTAWNVTFAVILVIVFLGWTGGKAVVQTTCGQARDKTRELSEERKAKRANRHAGDDADEPAPS